MLVSRISKRSTFNVQRSTPNSGDARAFWINHPMLFSLMLVRRKSISMGLAARSFSALAGALIVITLSSCLAMNPKPEGFRENTGAKRLMVNKTLQFTIVTGLAKVKPEITVPEGTYQQVASDSTGDYYMSSAGRIPIRTFYTDFIYGGIYRRNSVPPAYFLFSTARTGMEFVTRGSYPRKLEAIPEEFSKMITAK
jgi:hypothetical protein